ncbi:MAG: hypothetical protein WC526_03600 [Patescibacteria group bacterium]
MENTSALGDLIGLAMLCWLLYVIIKHSRTDHKDQKQSPSCKVYNIFSYTGFDFGQYKLFRSELQRSFEYYRWRVQVLFRAGYRCQRCGCKYALEVHHKKTLCQIVRSNRITSVPEAINCFELWDVENGEVLCKYCHEKEGSSVYFLEKHGRLA